MPVLAPAFIAASPPQRWDAETPQELEAALQAVTARARAAWPSLRDADDLAFVAHLAARMPAVGSALDGLASLRTDDLYLACACLKKAPSALAAFDDVMVQAIVRRMRRAGVSAATVDDVAQTLRMRLFATPDNEPQKLESYSGRGKLVSWLHVMALRDTLALERRSRREALVGDEEGLTSPLHEQLVRGDPEIDAMKRRFGAVFQGCFRAAVHALTPEERNLLRYSVAHRLSVDEIGSLYGIHRATAARRVAAARARLTDEVLSRTSAALAVTDAELQSILRLIRSQLDLSLSALEDDDEVDAAEA